MKKRSSFYRLLVLTVFSEWALFCVADPLPGLDPIIFQLGRHDPTKALGELPRGPVNPPSASLDDHTLYAIVDSKRWYHM